MAAPSFNKLLVLVHIPKTAGTTLHKVIRQQCKPSRVLGSHYAVPDALKADAEVVKAGGKRKIDVMLGHMGLGAHEAHPDVRYVSCVRKPINRLWSHYHYARQSENHYLYDQIKENDYSFMEYVTSGISGELSNGMTRTLAGVENYHEAVVDDEVFARAKSNVEKYFDFVGLTERFDEGLVILERLYGWKRPFYIRRKVGSYKGGFRELSDSDRSAVEASNRYDLELYDWLKERFDDMGRELANWEGATEDFRRQNASKGKSYFYLREAFARLGVRCPV